MPSADASSADHAADRLLEAIRAKGAPVCLGLDPVAERLPRALAPEDGSRAAVAEAIGAFSRGIIDATADLVPCVKAQSACFERYGSDGVRELEGTLEHARAAGLQIILDVKRGDIGISAEHYAAAAFDAGAASADWVTISAYLGNDSVAPFLRSGRGAFALVRTSNPGGDAVQSAALAQGGTVADHVARMVREIGALHLGPSGFSSLGAVVGATKSADAARLRALMPEQMFLVPGYGAQGGSADDVLPCFRADGSGAIITASRSVIYAFDPEDSDWKNSVRDAAAAFARDIAALLRRHFP